MKRKLGHITPEEDAAINHGIALDPDTTQWTAEDWAAARPTREVMPELVEWYSRTRGWQKSPTKVLVSLRLDRDLVTALRASGRGWQGRVNDVLKKIVL
jgi:uncharacterized protein (DUF4415 family)